MTGGRAAKIFRHPKGGWGGSEKNLGLGGGGGGGAPKMCILQLNNFE